MDKYEILSQLKEGKDVWLVKDQSDGHLYVLKHLRNYDREVYERLLRLSLPGLPRLISVLEDGGVLTIVEEYIHGTTAETMLSQYGPFSPDDAEKIAMDICSILYHLHKQAPPLIHRDIKPSNLMIDQNREVWLLDFNAMREIKRDSRQDTRLMGTPEFAAPEQYGFGQSDARTDIYGLGVTLHVLLTGKLPGCTEDPPPFRDIISRCTRIDPDERYSNIEELYQALSAAKNASARKADPFSIEPPADGGWRTFLPVGFRTGKWWHILIAVFVYTFFGYMLYDITWTDGNGGLLPPAAQIIDKCMLFSITVFLIAWFGNYRGIQDRLPGCTGRGWISVLFTTLWGLSISCLILILFALATLFV